MPRRFASRASSLISAAAGCWLEPRPSTSIPWASAISRMVLRSFRSGRPAAAITPIGPNKKPAISQAMPLQSLALATLAAARALPIATIKVMTRSIYSKASCFTCSQDSAESSSLRDPSPHPLEQRNRAFPHFWSTTPALLSYFRQPYVCLFQRMENRSQGLALRLEQTLALTLFHLCR